jgi:nucleotide-binding universal stress UspA family protein
MLSLENHYTIVVGADYSETSDEALDEAFAAAHARRGAEVHVLHVALDLANRPRAAHFEREWVPDLEQHDPRSTLDELEQHAVSRMKRFAERSGPPRFVRLVSHFRLGSPAEQLVQLAADLDADLLVVGTHGRRGVQRLLLGSVAERVIRLAHCPVLVVRPKDHLGLRGARLPQVAPPCPACLARRRETRGAELWCSEHGEPHLRPHVMSFTRDADDAAQDDAVKPAGST